MPTPLGRRATRLTALRSLRSVKGRRERSRFFLEGATLLSEALGSGMRPEALYVTDVAYAESAIVRELDAEGTPTFTIDERTAQFLSDVESPSGIFAVAASRLVPPLQLLAAEGVLLVLADLNDPGNAGTLIRSAEAFGATGVLFGTLGVDPWHPKVVRAAMGSLFRLAVGIGDPSDLVAAARERGTTVVGLARGGMPINGVQWPTRAALVVGHERHGLGPWEQACALRLEVPLVGSIESLNAAVAGSIALYETRNSRV